MLMRFGSDMWCIFKWILRRQLKVYRNVDFIDGSRNENVRNNEKRILVKFQIAKCTEEKRINPRNLCWINWKNNNSRDNDVFAFFFIIKLHSPLRIFLTCVSVCWRRKRCHIQLNEFATCIIIHIYECKHHT